MWLGSWLRRQSWVSKKQAKAILMAPESERERERQTEIKIDTEIWEQSFSYAVFDH